MNALTPCVAALVLLASVCPAQQEQEQEKQLKLRQERRLQEVKAAQERQRTAEDKDKGGNPADVAGEGMVDGTSVTANAVTPTSRESLSNACSLQPMCSPKRLAPGETGTVTLLLALQAHAVIQADAVWQVTYKP